MENKVIMECSECGASERRDYDSPYYCPWCGEGVMTSRNEEE